MLKELVALTEKARRQPVSHAMNSHANGVSNTAPKMKVAA
jgi:hypothetical protein